MPKVGTECLEWMNANEDKLGKLAGQWVAFVEEKGVISSGPTLSDALKRARLPKGSSSPYLFKVPSPRELESFDPF
jgi:hypothetical protein